MFRKMLWALIALTLLAPAPAAIAALYPAVSSMKANVATTDPTASNDASQGYVAGSVWTNTVTGERWFLKDATAGAAKWVAQANVIMFQPAYVSGFWYLPPQIGVLGGITLTANKMTLVPFILSQPATIKALGIKVITAATGNVGDAIYGSNANNMPTGTPLASVNGLSTGTQGPVTGTVGTTTLQPGILYWMAINCDNSTAAVAGVASSSAGNMATLIGASIPGNVLTGGAAVGGANGYYVTQTYGTWPDLTSATFTNTGNANAPVSVFQIL